MAIPSGYPYSDGDELPATDVNTIVDSMKFGGTGADGDKTFDTSEDIDAGGQQVVVKNYENLTINSGVTIGLINKHARGTMLIIKVRGDLTWAGKVGLAEQGADSSQNGTGYLGHHFAIQTNHDTDVGDRIYENFAGAGQSGPSGGGSFGTGGNGGGAGSLNDGDDGAGSGSTDNAPDGKGGRKQHGVDTGYLSNILNKTLIFMCGNGGGDGGNDADGTPSGGQGGKGGGCVVFEVLGSTTIENTAEVDLSAGDGSTGTDRGDGGGGSAGLGGLLHEGSLTDNGLTKTLTGGTGPNDAGNGSPGAFEFIENTEIT